VTLGQTQEKFISYYAVEEKSRHDSIYIYRKCRGFSEKDRFIQGILAMSPLLSMSRRPASAVKGLSRTETT
jgi:hypothetical protein